MHTNERSGFGKISDLVRSDAKLFLEVKCCVQSLAPKEPASVHVLLGGPQQRQVWPQQLEEILHLHRPYRAAMTSIRIPLRRLDVDQALPAGRRG